MLETPFPMLTYEEALERFGSDKPDIRFGMELVDLGPALVAPDGAPSSGFGVFDSALAAGGRVKAIVAPGMAGVTRREIDELTERARRFGAKGLAYLALEPGGEVRRPIAKFLSDDTQRAIIEAGDGERGRPHPHRRRHRGRHRGRPRAAARRARRQARPGRPERPVVRLDPPLPDVPVGPRDRPLARDAQPVLRRPARGRGAARDRVGRSRDAVAGRPGRARPGAPVRPRAQRLGARWRLDPDPSPRPARAELPAPGPHARGRCARSSGRSSTPSTTARRRTAGSPSASTAGPRCSRSRRTSARSWPSRRRSPAAIRCSRRHRSRNPASTRNSACASSACRPGRIPAADS